MYKVIVYTCVFEGAPYFNDFESMCAPHFRLGKRQISTQCQEIRQFLSRYWGPITPHSSHRLMFSQKIEWRAAANAPDRRCSISLTPSLPLWLSLSFSPSLSLSLAPSRALSLSLSLFFSHSHCITGNLLLGTNELEIAIEQQ